MNTGRTLVSLVCTLDVLDYLRFLEKFWDHVHVNSSATFDNVNHKTQQVTATARKYVTLLNHETLTPMPAG